MTIIAEVSQDLRIVSYEYGWKLERPRLRNGELVWQAFKWCSTFRRSLEEAGNYEIRQIEANTLADAIDGVSQIAQRYGTIFDDAIAQATSSTDMRLVSCR